MTRTRTLVERDEDPKNLMTWIDVGNTARRENITPETHELTPFSTYGYRIRLLGFVRSNGYTSTTSDPWDYLGLSPDRKVKIQYCHNQAASGTPGHGVVRASSLRFRVRRTQASETPTTPVGTTGTATRTSKTNIHGTTPTRVDFSSLTISKAENGFVVQAYDHTHSTTSQRTFVFNTLEEIVAAFETQS